MWDTSSSYTKVVQAATLRDVLDGNIPQRINLVDDVPFNFQKNEELVWIFKDVDYYEEKKRPIMKAAITVSV